MKNKMEIIDNLIVQLLEIKQGTRTELIIDGTVISNNGEYQNGSVEISFYDDIPNPSILCGELTTEIMELEEKVEKLDLIKKLLDE